MIKLCYDARWLGPTGIGVVASALLKRTPEDIRVNPLMLASGIADPLSPIPMGRRIKASKADVFWSPGFMAPFGAGTPSIVTVHDLTHLHYYSAAHRLYYNGVLKRLYRRCAKIVTVSEFTRDELISWGGFEPEHIEVVPNGIEPTFNPSVTPVEPGYAYILYAGNRRSYKNIRGLIQSFAASHLPLQGVHLVISGNSDIATQKIVCEFGMESFVKFSGFISDQDLPRYYRGASAVVYISLYEGFGLPVLEGMASGVPVITSNVSSMPEVAGNGAVLVDPRDIECIADAMNRVVFDSVLRKDLVARGLDRASNFSWDRSAEKFWSLVRRVGSSHAN